MAARNYHVAGEDITLLLPFLVDTPQGQDYRVPDPGSATYSLRRHDGTLSSSILNLAIPTTASSTEAVVVVPFLAANKTRPMERRALEYRWTVGGVPYRREIRFWLIDRLLYDAEPADVRARLGISVSELPDDEIDLVAAYYDLAAKLGGTVLADNMATGDIQTLRSNRALVTTEALRLLPSLRLRAAQAQASGTESFGRFDVDWEALKRDLEAELGEAIELMVPVTGTAIFILSTQDDPFGQGG